MPAELVAFLLCGRRGLQERPLFRGHTAPNPLVVEPLDDRLGIDVRRHSDHTLEDNGSDRDLAGRARGSLRVLLNRWWRCFPGNTQRLCPRFNGEHFATSSRQRPSSATAAPPLRL